MSECLNRTPRDVGTQATVSFGLPDVFVAKGAHIAHFFKGEEERLTVLAPFINAGLGAGEQCLLVADTWGSSDIKLGLKELGVEVERALADGQLIAIEGSRDVEEMASIIPVIISRARRAGRESQRIAGDMTWALGKMTTAEQLLEWEALYSKYVAPKANFVTLCQYDRNRFDGSAVMGALQTHPFFVIGDIVQENPFYREPDEVLRELHRGHPTIV